MHFLQIVDNRRQQNVIREKCMASVKRFVSDSDTYTVKEIAYNSNVAEMIHEADKIRFTYAKGYDDLIYVDTDCFLSALPNETQVQKKMVVAGETNGNADIFLFYVNGNSTFFKENYDVLTRVPKPNAFSVSQEALALLKTICIPYDNLSYCHYSFTSLEVAINKEINAVLGRKNALEKELNAYRGGLQNLNVIAQTFDELRIKENSNG